MGRNLVRGLFGAGVCATMLFGFTLNVHAEEMNVTDENSLSSCVQENNTCTLQKDISLSETLTINKNVTFDLNGHTLSANISGNKSAIEVDAAKLIINDSKNSGMIVNESGYGIYALNNGTIEVNGGTLKSQYAPLTGNNTTGDMNFIVNGGIIEAVEGPAIYMPGQVTLEINGGTLKGGISLRMGQVTINGGNIINDNSKNTDSIQQYYNYGGNIWFSDAIAIVGGTYTSENAKYGNSLNLTINGGTIESTVGNGISIYALGKEKQDMDIKINGGTIKGTKIAYTVETPATLGINDTNYTKITNNPVTAITKGTFNSDISKYVADGAKISENNGIFTVGNDISEVETPEGQVPAEENASDKSETVNIENPKTSDNFPIYLMGVLASALASGICIRKLA